MKVFKIVLILLSYVILASFKNKDVDLHTQIFSRIIQLKMNSEYVDYYYLNDKYYIANGGFGIVPESFVTINNIDSLQTKTISLLTKEFSNLKNLNFISNLPCVNCPFWLYAKSNILKLTQSPENSRYIEICQPIESWESLIRIDDFVLLDEKYDNAIISIPVMSICWSNLEPIKEVFIFKIKFQNDIYNVEFIKKIVL